MYPPKDPCCDEIGTCFSKPYDYTGHCNDISVTSSVLGILLIIGTIISVLP